MSVTLIIPEEKTMALGGVPTGKANANEHAKVVGSMSVRGLICKFSARPATIGTKMLAVTVLLQMFVTPMVTRMHTSWMTITGSPSNFCSIPPIT